MDKHYNHRAAAKALDTWTESMKNTDTSREYMHQAAFIDRSKHPIQALNTLLIVQRHAIKNPGGFRVGNIVEMGFALVAFRQPTRGKEDKQICKVVLRTLTLLDDPTAKNGLLTQLVSEGSPGCVRGSGPRYYNLDIIQVMPDRTRVNSVPHWNIDMPKQQPEYPGLGVQGFRRRKLSRLVNRYPATISGVESFRVLEYTGRIMLGRFQLGVLEEDQALGRKKSSLSASRYSVPSDVLEVTAGTTAIIKWVKLRFHRYCVQVNADREDPFDGLSVSFGLVQAQANERWVALKEAEAGAGAFRTLLECVQAQMSRGAAAEESGAMPGLAGALLERRGTDEQVPEVLSTAMNGGNRIDRGGDTRTRRSWGSGAAHRSGTGPSTHLSATIAVAVPKYQDDGNAGTRYGTSGEASGLIEVVVLRARRLQALIVQRVPKGEKKRNRISL
ncbi:hypothetical protein B0H17DRAFT_1127065 [Mycena rosella]|uniref:Uncharacterized protein n=1 Tax=Mycena rosella TaxID=1033263 RepID=A0AAD7GS33_MYCRO|nr:hypothetical protein B0H17DRAFT_1127065 [Mycena rosella]